MSDKECAKCGSELDSDEGYWHEDYNGDICRECYDEETNDCTLCGEDIMPSDTSEFIVVKCELAETADKPPGIYRIMSRPFLSIPLIGSGSLDGNDVLFTERLPKQDCEYDISGYICKKCARPYEKRFKEVYGRLRDLRARFHFVWPPRLTIRQPTYCFDRYAEWLESCHIKATIRAYPEMLYDLECEPDDEGLEDFFERYELSDEVVDTERPWRTKQVCRYKTWRDWLAMEHRGIKVYFTSEHQGLYGEGRWEAMALRPEPHYRQMAWNSKRDPMLVYPHELPTIPLVKQTYHLRHGTSRWYKYSSGEIEERKLMASDLRAAIILAIDRGAEGFHKNDPGSIHADGVIQELQAAA